MLCMLGACEHNARIYQPSQHLARVTRPQATWVTSLPPTFQLRTHLVFIFAVLPAVRVVQHDVHQRLDAPTNAAAHMSHHHSMRDPSQLHAALRTQHLSHFGHRSRRPVVQCVRTKLQTDDSWARRSSSQAHPHSLSSACVWKPPGAVKYLRRSWMSTCKLRLRRSWTNARICTIHSKQQTAAVPTQRTNHW